MGNMEQMPEYFFEKRMTSIDFFNFSKKMIKMVGGESAFFLMIQEQLNNVAVDNKVSVILPSDKEVKKTIETILKEVGWSIFKKEGEGIGDKDTIYSR